MENVVLTTKAKMSEEDIEVIKELQLTYLGELDTIRANSGEAWNKVIDTPALEWAMNHFDNHSDYALVMEEGQIVGFMMYSSFKYPSGHLVGGIDEIYVRPESRGNGYAKAMIEKLKSHYKEIGITEIGLNVAAANPAKKVYDALGFKPAAIRGYIPV